MDSLKHALIVLVTWLACMACVAGAAAKWVSSTAEPARAEPREPAVIAEVAPEAPPPSVPPPAAAPVSAPPPIATPPSAPPPPAARLARTEPAPSREAFVGVLLPEHAADVSAQQAGLVRTLHVSLGQVVLSGEVLVSLAVDQAALDHTRAVAEREAARAALSRSQIERTHAASEANRSTQLAQEGLATQEELSQARFKLSQSFVLASEAEARLRERSARADQLAQLRDQGRVVASFRGRVAARYVSEGALVAAGTPLLRLISDETVLLRFAIPEHVGELPMGSRVTLVPNEHPELKFAATVVRISPEIDAASRLRTVEASPTDAKALIARGLIGAIVSVSLSESQSVPQTVLAARRGAP